MEISSKDAARVIRALRSGSTPAVFARELAVGRRRWFEAAIENMKETADCEYLDVRFVRARYGGGKTHFLRCLQAEARDRGWVTAYVLLKQGEVELDRFDTLVAEIAAKLEFPDGGRGILYLLQQGLAGISSKAGVDIARPAFTNKERALSAIDGFSRSNALGYQFALFLRASMVALLRKDDVLLQQYGGWLSGSKGVMTIDPRDLVVTQAGQTTRASKAQLKPLGLGDAEQLIRLLALLVRAAGATGLFLAIDEVELISSQPSRRRGNSFQTLRELVDQTDEHLLPPATCIYLAATPDMFENPEMFPSYKALQDRIEELPSLGGGNAVNYRAPVVNLDVEDLRKDELLELSEKVLELFRCAGREVSGMAKARVGALVEAVCSSNYVIAKPRLTCRCLIDLFEGRLGDDMSQEIARSAEEIRSQRSKDRPQEA